MRTETSPKERLQPFNVRHHQEAIRNCSIQFRGIQKNFIHTEFSFTRNVKKPTITKLKKKLDAVFSQFIRLSYADKNGFVSCYTCPVKRHWKDSMQNGHFVPRQYLKTRWDERNCRPQCYACNQLYNGQPSKFAARLVEEYGQGIVEELEKDRIKPVKLDVLWYQDQINHYEHLVSQLQKES